MKNLFFIICLFFSYFSDAQNIIGKWKINTILWNKETNEINLTSIKNQHEYYSRYGTFIEFKKDKTFTNYNSAPCGVDCFSSSKGTYKIIDKNQIEITVTYIEKQGMTCEEFHENGNWKLGTYTIQHTENGLLLIK